MKRTTYIMYHDAYEKVNITTRGASRHKKESDCLHSDKLCGMPPFFPPSMPYNIPHSGVHPLV